MTKHIRINLLCCLGIAAVRFSHAGVDEFALDYSDQDITTLSNVIGATRNKKEVESELPRISDFVADFFPCPETMAFHHENQEAIFLVTV